jgi:hypothetical protein
MRRPASDSRLVRVRRHGAQALRHRALCAQLVHNVYGAVVAVAI